MIGDTFEPGPIVLFGSGETSPSGRKAFDWLMHRLPSSPKVALIETPAGFELNSAQVIGRVGEFIRHRLQNYAPQIEVIPARMRGTQWSPDDPKITAPILDSDLIFMGPGSPTYAIRQLRDSLAWYLMLARHRLGAALALASAATIAFSAYALPVYEIYKVGEELHWNNGLDFFGAFGLPLVFIPHWNNNDGGEELDTSRCFMGQSRFAKLLDLLPTDLTVVGIDEKTALLIDLQSRVARVTGLGGVTLLHIGHSHEHRPLEQEALASGLLEIAEHRQAHVHFYRSGDGFPLSVIGDFYLPDASVGLPAGVWRQAQERTKAFDRAAQERSSSDGQPWSGPVPEEVLVLVGQREAARKAKEWPEADKLRGQIASLGWVVQDTPDGPKVERKGS